jgi:hypothetical protein
LSTITEFVRAGVGVCHGNQTARAGAPGVFSGLRKAITVAGVLLFAAGVHSQAQAIEDVPGLGADEAAMLDDLLKEATPSAWSTTGSARATSGYRDNILLSAYNPVSAAFVGAGGDFMLTRSPVDGTEFSLLASADGSYFIDAPQAEPEAIAFVQARVARDVGSDWKAGLKAQYVYLHQVFDVSATEAAFNTATARGNTFLLAPLVSRALGKGWNVEFAPAGICQLFTQPLDSYWETVPEFTLTKAAGKRADAALNIRLGRRWYEDRPPLTADGLPMPGTLKFLAEEADLRPRVYWDEARRFSSYLRLGIGHNADNGGGYFDFMRYSAGAGLKYQADTWAVRAEARALWYDYSVQKAAGPFSPLRSKQDITAMIRGEYRLARKWLAFAQWDRESALDNAPASSYNASVYSAGIEWEF